jgi:hypothetical protein
MRPPLAAVLVAHEQRLFVAYLCAALFYAMVRAVV